MELRLMIRAAGFIEDREPAVVRLDGAEFG